MVGSNYNLAKNNAERRSSEISEKEIEKLNVLREKNNVSSAKPSIYTEHTQSNNTQSTARTCPNILSDANPSRSKIDKLLYHMISTAILNKQSEKLEKPYSERDVNQETNCESGIFSDDKENLINNKWTRKCHEDEVCPTMSLVLNRKRFQKAVRTVTESCLPEASQGSQLNSSEIKITFFKNAIDDNSSSDEEEGSIVSKKYNCGEGRPCPTVSSVIRARVGQPETNDSGKWMWNCYEGKPCAIFDSFFVENVSQHMLNEDSSKLSTSELILVKESALRVIKLDNQDDPDEQPSVIVFPTSQVNAADYSKKLLQKSVVTGPVHISQKEKREMSSGESLSDTLLYNDKENELEVIAELGKEDDISQRTSTATEPSKNIGTVVAGDNKKRDVSNKVSAASQKQYENENKLDKWRRNCRQGIFSLKSLLDVCEKNPDSLLTLCIANLNKDRKLPKDSFEEPDQTEEYYKLEQTHGKNLGDSKYHFLMVDASTSIRALDIQSGGHQVIAKPPQVVKSDSVHSEESAKEVFETIMKEAEDDTISFDEPEETEEHIPDTPLPPPAPQLLSVGSIVSNQETNVIDEVDEDDEDHRSSTVSVSWRAMGNPEHEGDGSTESLDQVVKEATAKAATLRQNLDSTRQHSLLDIMKRRGSTDTRIDEPIKEEAFVNVNNNINKSNEVEDKPKRCAFFKKLFKKKKPPVKEKEEEMDDISEAESAEEAEEKKQNSQTFVDTYRRRNTSFMENPVFEKKKELNQYLDNI